jgi:recombination protein RecA
MNITPLSESTRDIILGSLLGDGSLAKNPKYKNARFSFRHSIKQKDYFFWKMQMLQEICGESCYWLQGTEKKPDGWGTKKYRFQSRALPSLTELYDLTHYRVSGTKVRVTRKWLNRLSPLSLAIWWMDDGSLVSDSRQGVICTDGFSLKEVKIINQYFKNILKIETKIGRVTHQDKYRIWIRSTEELKKFLKIIIPHVFTKSMLYKVLLVYKDSQIQQRWISELVSLGNFSQQEIEHALLDKKSRSKQFQIKI